MHAYKNDTQVYYFDAKCNAVLVKPVLMSCYSQPKFILAGPERRNQSTKNQEIRQNQSVDTALPDEYREYNFGALVLALSFRRSRFRRSDLDPIHIEKYISYLNK